VSRAVGLTVVNEPAAVAEVAAALDALAAAHGVPAEAVMDMQVALDEVVANVIAHAWPEGGRHEIRVRLAVTDAALTAEVEDDGIPFDPLAQPPPADLHAPLEARRVGGLGIHLVRSLMSRVAYARLDNLNRLVLERELLPHPGEGPARGAA
jgi:serine/threonine-protein kinase RsbW